MLPYHVPFLGLSSNLQFLSCVERELPSCGFSVSWWGRDCDCRSLVAVRGRVAGLPGFGALVGRSTFVRRFRALAGPGLGESPGGWIRSASLRPANPAQLHSWRRRSAVSVPE